MTCHSAPHPIPPQLEEKMSQLFWHHSRWFRRIGAVILLLAAAAVTLLILGWIDAAAACVVLESFLSPIAAWHFGRASMATHLRFGITP